MKKYQFYATPGIDFSMLFHVHCMHFLNFSFFFFFFLLLFSRVFNICFFLTSNCLTISRLSSYVKNLFFLLFALVGFLLCCLFIFSLFSGTCPRTPPPDPLPPDPLPSDPPPSAGPLPPLYPLRQTPPSARPPLRRTPKTPQRFFNSSPDSFFDFFSAQFHHLKCFHNTHLGSLDIL